MSRSETSESLTDEAEVLALPGGDFAVAPGHGDEVI
jgi:hypothetical protein